MAKTEQMKAGQYEIVRPNTRFRQTTSAPGKPHEWTEYVTGDVVDLTAEDATRLADILGKPGERARREAETHRAAAERAAAAADAAEAKAKEHESAAKSAAKAPAAEAKA